MNIKTLIPKKHSGKQADSPPFVFCNKKGTLADAFSKTG
jgi:hypothetical protein